MFDYKFLIKAILLITMMLVAPFIIFSIDKSNDPFLIFPREVISSS